MFYIYNLFSSVSTVYGETMLNVANAKTVTFVVLFPLLWKKSTL